MPLLGRVRPVVKRVGQPPGLGPPAPESPVPGDVFIPLLNAQSPKCLQQGPRSIGRSGHGKRAPGRALRPRPFSSDFRLHKSRTSSALVAQSARTPPQDHGRFSIACGQIHGRTVNAYSGAFSHHAIPSTADTIDSNGSEHPKLTTCEGTPTCLKASTRPCTTSGSIASRWWISSSAIYGELGTM